MILHGASCCQVVPVSSLFVCTFSTYSGKFRNFVPIFFTKFHTIRTNMTDSLFYSTKCIISQILRRLAPRSARRDLTCARYGRSDCRRDFDLKLASDAWEGARERGVAATAHNKLSSLLYPMISNTPGSN